MIFKNFFHKLYIFQLPEAYSESVIRNAEYMFQNLEIVLGYPKSLLNETLINNIYSEFSPGSKNFFLLAQELVAMSEKALPGFRRSDFPSLLVDNAYFLHRDRTLNRHRIGNSCLTK